MVSFQSMHWCTPKFKDRMLPEGSVSSGFGRSGLSSEDGANLHCGNNATSSVWDSETSTEVIKRFRNYEI